MDKCPECKLENLERYWLDKNDQYVCAYCYNGNYTIKKIEKIRNKYAKEQKTNND